jgi:FKBP-type peptidyl-prolyl cis-trans isomerase
MRALLVLLFAALPLIAADKPVPPVDLAQPPADAERLESGLVTKQLVAGKGLERPNADDVVKVRYTVWKADGTLVQHVAPGRSLAIELPKMVPGWASAVRLMGEGESRRAWVPAGLGGGKLKEGEMLVIDTDLIEIIRKPLIPTNVDAPPADATVTESGLAYKVLRAGTGTARPRRSDTVVVHYTGWMTDGKMIDSSVLRGEPAVFKLTGVIAGWTEGLQLMVAGEKTRFWIPSKLAYGKDPRKPQGMLVFDIELIEIR